MADKEWAPAIPDGKYVSITGKGPCDCQVTWVWIKSGKVSKFKREQADTLPANLSKVIHSLQDGNGQGK